MTKNLIVALALAVLVAGCSRNASQTTTTTSTAAPAPKPAADGNQAGAGDIPDTQAFVRYDGPSYSVLVPEGWSRTERPEAVMFTWNADGITVLGNPPADTQLPQLLGATGKVTTRHATVAGSPVTILSFTSTGRPDPVTGKALKLESQAYVFSKGGRRTALTMWAPAGADNVDQWKKITESFRWK